MTEKPDISPLAYPDSAILTRRQLALWLQVSEHTVKEWPLPRLKLPSGTVRYSAGAVLACLEDRYDAYLKRAV